MNYYGYSDKKSKYKRKKNRLWFNILIIALIAVGVVVISLVLGNHLKGKLDNAPISQESFVPTPEETDDGEEYEEPLMKNSLSYEELATVAGYLDLEGCKTEADAVAFVTNLKNCGYSGVYFTAKNSDGRITFASEAVSALTGITPGESLVSTAVLKTAAATAKTYSMKTGFGMSFAEVFSQDELGGVTKSINKHIIIELYNAGFEEVILYNIFDDDNFNSDSSEKLNDFVGEIRSMCPEIKIGIVLDPSIFQNHEITPIVELVFRCTDFFAIDLTSGKGYSNEDITTLLDTIRGSINAYYIRVLTDGSSVKQIQENYALFSRGEHVNLSFVSPNLDRAPKKDDDDDKDKDKEPVGYKAKIFPYSLIIEKTDAEEK